MLHFLDELKSLPHFSTNKAFRINCALSVVIIWIVMIRRHFVDQIYLIIRAKSKRKEKHKISIQKTLICHICINKLKKKIRIKMVKRMKLERC